MEFDYETISGEMVQVCYTNNHYKIFDYKGNSIKKLSLSPIDIQNIEAEIEERNNYEDIEEELGYYE